MKTPKMMVTLLLAGCLVSPVIAQKGNTGADVRRDEFLVREFMRGAAREFKVFNEGYDPAQQVAHATHNVYHNPTGRYAVALADKLDSTSGVFGAAAEFGDRFTPADATTYRVLLRAARRSLEPLIKNYTTLPEGERDANGNFTPTATGVAGSRQNMEAQIAANQGEDPQKLRAIEICTRNRNEARSALCTLRGFVMKLGNAFGRKYVEHAKNGTGNLRPEEAKAIKEAYVDNAGCR